MIFLWLLNTLNEFNMPVICRYNQLIIPARFLLLNSTMIPISLKASCLVAKPFGLYSDYS
jgi:hypothetical protein